MAVDYLRQMSIFTGLGGGIYGSLQLGFIKTLCYVEGDVYCRSLIQQRIADAIFDKGELYNDISEIDVGKWRGKIDILLCGRDTTGDIVTLIEELEPIYIIGIGERFSKLVQSWGKMAFASICLRPRYFGCPVGDDRIITVGKSRAEGNDKPGICRVDDGAATRSFRFKTDVPLRFHFPDDTGADREKGEGSALRVLWEAFEKKKIQRQRQAARRSGSVLQEAFLQPGMQAEQRGISEDLARRLQEESEKIQKELLRDVRDNGEPPDPSCGRRLVEQLPGEFDDFMHYTSYDAPLEGLALLGGEVVRGLWRACCEIGVLRETLQTLPEVWKSLSDEEKRWIILRVDRGNPRHSEWPGVVREVQEDNQSRERIRALKNTVMPEMIVVAWQILSRM